jgi:hypothetical protein
MHASMIRIGFLIINTILVGFSCSTPSSQSTNPTAQSMKNATGLVDEEASVETVRLYNGLQLLLNKGIMFGHQDDLAYGVGWKYHPGRSDIKDVTGDYPAVQGYELGHLELDEPVNLDSVPFLRMQDFIRTTYIDGGVITISWHLRNPLTGKTSWDPAPGTVASILPGGEKNELYKNWLGKVARLLTAPKGSRGENIPVIFRPFHELNGNWFWWGKAHCTPEEYKKLFQFTVTYLRDSLNVHNFLYAYNTDRFSSKEEYLERYPGDEFVDLIGFDVYQRGIGTAVNERFIKEVGSMLTMLEEMAVSRKKIPALTEFGFGTVPDSTWWTNVFWPTLKDHKISYALAWRNAGYKPDSKSYEFYVPYAGHPSTHDFIKFYNEPRSLFLKEVAREKIYGR